jgi:AbrB family looped-hinge helix DNA binding protein
MKDNSIKNKFAATVTVGAKGQIVIPKEMREMFGIMPGDNLMILADKKQGIAIPPKNMFTSLFAKIFGGKAVDSDDDNEDNEEV